jgi:hypothetical protein
MLQNTIWWFCFLYQLKVVSFALFIFSELCYKSTYFFYNNLIIPYIMKYIMISLNEKMLVSFHRIDNMVFLLLVNIFYDLDCKQFYNIPNCLASALSAALKCHQSSLLTPEKFNSCKTGTASKLQKLPWLIVWKTWHQSLHPGRRIKVKAPA